MKLRIRGDSLRLRLTRGELASVVEQGAAEDAVHFPGGAALRYRLEVKPAGGVEASFGAGAVSVAVPEAEVRRWQRDDEVSIEGRQELGEGRSLRILVEKDYTCLTPRSGEDDSDLFVNPNERAAPRD